MSEIVLADNYQFFYGEELGEMTGKLVWNNDEKKLLHKAGDWFSFLINESLDNFDLYAEDDYCFIVENPDEPSESKHQIINSLVDNNYVNKVLEIDINDFGLKAWYVKIIKPNH